VSFPEGKGRDQQLHPSGTRGVTVPQLSSNPDTVQEEALVKELIESIAKALVDSPDEVAVRSIEGEQSTVLELRVAPSDLGKVIGKQGRTARSIRTILGAAGMKLKRRFTLEILE
jgi:predicted RNA-binding protein YlqC (UPF0109 family)